MPKNNITKHNTYYGIPKYRRHNNFWAIYFILPIVAIVILMTGDVYYKRQGRIRRFDDSNTFIALGLAGLWLGQQIYILFKFMN